MAKRSGTGQRLLVCAVGSGPAYDISGDVGSVDTAESMFATIDDTGIDKLAHERMVGLGDGKLSYTAYHNNAAGGQHAVVSLLNGTPVRALWLGSATEGDGLAFGIAGILSNYPVARAAGGALTAKPSIDGYNGDFPDWGVLLAKATDASGTVNHTGVDLGNPVVNFTITGITRANPAVVTIAGAHGLTTGDSVNIALSNSTPVVDGDWVATVTGPSSFSVPVDTSAGSVGTAGTVQRTSFRLGGVLTAMLTSIGSGTNYTLQLQHSADGGIVDAYANVTGLVTPSLTAAAAEARVRVNSVLVKRWVRLVGAGTYTNAAVAAMFKRYQVAE